MTAEAGCDGDAPPRKLVLVNHHCPGDALVMSMAVASLHLECPGRFLTDVRCCARELYDNNPDIAPIADDDPEAERLDLNYPLIHECNRRPLHFGDAYTRRLGDLACLPLECRVNRPVLVLSEAERSWVNQVKEITGQDTKFWVVVAGHKRDYTTKGHTPEFWQGVADRLRGRVQLVQVGERSKGHDHPKLRGVLDLVGKTTTRQLVRLCWHAHGGAGPSTFLQHIMAAHGRPYVLIDSAREPASWMAYPSQTSLVKHGQYDCCALKSCWKSRVVALGDAKDHPDGLCKRPVLGGSAPVTQCLEAIRPRDAAAAILGYYDGGALAH